jgi:hypothetical protein
VREPWRDAFDIWIFLAQCSLAIFAIYLLAFGVPLLLVLIVSALLHLGRLVW